MQKLLIALIMLVSLNGFGQIVRTLGNVSNTTDTLKPISNAQRTVNTSTAASIATKQNTLSGTGFVRISSGTISYDASTYLTSITSGNVTTALGFSPYNATNPNAYIPLTGLSSTATGLTYTNTTGVFSLTSGYVIPTSSQLATYLTTTAASSTYSPIASPIFTGDIEATTLNSGVIIKSPNGTRFRITISNTGDIIGTSL